MQNRNIPADNKGDGAREVAVWRDKGKLVPILTPDQVDYALECISAGEDADQVARSLGVTIGAFNARARDNADFARAYTDALEAGAETFLNEAKRGLIDVGDARKLADLAMWRAERLSKRFAAKSLISAESITITLKQGVDDDWDAGE